MLEEILRNSEWPQLGSPDGRCGEGNGTPLQYSCLENPMDGGAWQAAVHGVTKSGTQLSDFISLFTFMHWRRKWQPTPVFLPGESQGRWNRWAAIYGVAQSRTRLKRLSSSRWEMIIKKWKEVTRTVPSSSRHLVCQVASVLSDSVRPHGLQAARLLCSQDSPGKSTRVDCHALLKQLPKEQELWEAAGITNKI